MVFLPNGISSFFGPVSYHLHDVNRVLEMSDLNQFLINVQQQNENEYQALGGSISSVTLHCICSYFKSYAGQPSLTNHQLQCNAAMKNEVSQLIGIRVMLANTS